MYERKTFILGLTSAFNAEVMPPSMQTHLLKIIQQIIAMLNKLKEQEARSLQKAAKKEIKATENDDDDDDDDDDEDGDSDEDEEEGAYEDADEDDHMQEDEEEEAKHSEAEEDGATGGGGPADSTKKLKKKTTSAAYDEEEKGGNGGLGFVDNDEENEDGDLDDDDDDEEEEELDEAFDLNVTMDMLNAPFKKADEFGYFNSHFRSLYDRDMTYINNLVAQMNEVEKKFLQELMDTKRIKITN